MSLLMSIGAVIRSERHLQVEIVAEMRIEPYRVAQLRRRARSAQRSLTPPANRYTGHGSFEDTDEQMGRSLILSGDAEPSMGAALTMMSVVLDDAVPTRQERTLVRSVWDRPWL